MAYINHVELLYNSYNNGMTMCCVTVSGTDNHEPMTSATSTLLMTMNDDDKSAAVCSKVSGQYEFLRSILCIHNGVIRMS